MKRTYKPLLLLIPILMFVVGTFITRKRYLKMSDEEIFVLFNSLLGNIFIAVLIGVCLGIIGAVLPFLWANTRATIGYSKRTWEVATLIAFIFFASPFLGLVKSVEWMVLLGSMSSVTVASYLGFFFLFLRVQSWLRKRNAWVLGGETMPTIDRKAP